MKSILSLAGLLLVLFASCGNEEDNELEATALETLVATHNTYRSAVGVEAIQWSEELATSAQKWADRLTSDCKLVHSETSNGENLWLGTTGFFDPEDVVNAWGAEIEFYNEETNQCDGGECLHYTQMVWQNSTEVGCGMSSCDGFDIWVCHYSPRGNIVGQRPY